MIAWWRNCRLITKLALCGASFTVPIVMLLVLLGAQMQRDIRLTRAEMCGMDVLDPLEDLNEILPEHLRLTLARLAGEGVDQPLAQARAAMHTRLETLAKRMSLSAARLGLDPATLAAHGLTNLEPGEFAKALQAQLNAKPAGVEQAIAAHSQMQQQINQLRDYLGDSAQLMLDPELTTYYLMYLLVNDLPRSLERLGRINTMGYVALAKLGAVNPYRASFEQYASLWEESVLERIRGKVNKIARQLEPEPQARMNKALLDYMESANAVFAAAKQASAQSSPTALAAFQQSGVQALKAGGALWDVCNEVTKGLLADRETRLKWRMGLALGVCLAAVLAAAWLAWAIVKSVTSPLSRLAGIASQVADGKVGQAAAMLGEAAACGRDILLSQAAGFKSSASETVQLYVAITSMIEGLGELLGQMTTSGGRIQGSAERIAASARQIEATAAQQAASTTEVGATSKEISNTAQELADTMAKVLGVARKSSELAQEGREGLADMEQAMDELSQASRDMTGKLSAIREKTSGIGQFLSTIAKVANQTNLLSLNASIEAEKAGEFGPGFAVVAREIRRLADQTASAALDIERTIREMQASVQAGVQAMDGFADKTALASDTTKAVGQKLARIIAAGEELTPRFSAVSQGMSAQAEGADQISAVIAGLAESAGQTRDALADFRLAAEELNATAQALRQSLSHFELDG